MSKIWTINPQFLDLDMAILMANIGQGIYLPKRFKSIWQLGVLRYIAGEINIKADDKRSLVQEAESVKGDLYSYVEEIKMNQRSLIDQIEEEYRIEELRSLQAELERIQEKEDFLLDLMKDNAHVKNKVLERQNKFIR